MKIIAAREKRITLRLEVEHEIESKWTILKCPSTWTKLYTKSLHNLVVKY